MIALAAKFNNHDLQASSAAPGKTWFHSFTKGLTESVIEGNFWLIKSYKLINFYSKEAFSGNETQNQKNYLISNCKLFCQSQTVVKSKQTNSLITFNTRLKTGFITLCPVFKYNCQWKFFVYGNFLFHYILGVLYNWIVFNFYVLEQVILQCY